MIKISTRLVILIFGYAIKIPFDKRGYLQGKNEAKIWAKYNKYCDLAPLVWECFGVVCQKRCSKLEVFDSCAVTELKALISEFNIDNCDLYNKHNWGMYKGIQVLLDYGIDERISKMY